MFVIKAGIHPFASIYQPIIFIFSNLLMHKSALTIFKLDFCL